MKLYTNPLTEQYGADLLHLYGDKRKEEATLIGVMSIEDAYGEALKLAHKNNPHS